VASNHEITGIGLNPLHAAEIKEHVNAIPLPPTDLQRGLGAETQWAADSCPEPEIVSTAWVERLAASVAQEKLEPIVEATSDSQKENLAVETVEEWIGEELSESEVVNESMEDTSDLHRDTIELQQERIELFDDILATSFAPPKRKERPRLAAQRQSGQELFAASPLSDVSPSPLEDNRTAWRGPTPPRAARWLARCGIGAAALGLLLAVLAAPFSPAPSKGGGEMVSVEIPPQSTVTDIGQILQEQGLLRSTSAFRLLAQATGADTRLRAGAYRLSNNAWTWQLLDELERGQFRSVTITVPEGLTLEDTAALMEESGIVAKSEFMRATENAALLSEYGIPAKNAEGYLFPETYTFAEGQTADQIVGMMVEQFFAEVGAIPAAARLGAKELHRRVTLASIVQREVKVPAEIRRIAGVFENRIAKDMRLESCATIQYLLGEPKERLLLDDLRIKSPYNTYLNPGLPPGPIGSTSRLALEASIRPEKHRYLFFVARQDGSGHHIFNETFEKHQQSQRRIRLATAEREAGSAPMASATVP
jgi:UPF0755 protein